MNCPDCHSGATQTLETRRVFTGDAAGLTRRRYECLEPGCHTRFTTFQAAEFIVRNAKSPIAVASARRDMRRAA
jgi:transcriptional regulator NrdR family protein